MDQFTFIQSPTEYLHQIIPEVLPGVKKVITINRENDGKLKGVYSEKETAYMTKEFDLSTKLPMVNKFMQDKQPQEWIRLQNLPFEMEVERSKPVLDIFSEYENSILLLRLPDGNTRKIILVFIFLNEDQSNFGVTNSTNKLTTDNKGIIAFMIRNTLIKDLKALHRNQSVLGEFNVHFEALNSKIDGLKRDIKAISEKYGNSLVRLVQQLFDRHGLQTGKSYKLSENAVVAIQNYEGELSLINSIVNKAVGFLNNLNFRKSNEIEVSDLHLKLDDPEMAKETEIPDARNDFYGKTIAMLNRLENAALVVKGKRMRLTGTNVGLAFPEPITAPAITDSLKNHHDKIVDLAKMYPTRWPTIRHEFKPMLNVLEK